jgi:hypothetical protein
MTTDATPGITPQDRTDGDLPASGRSRALTDTTALTDARVDLEGVCDRREVLSRAEGSKAVSGGS